MSPDGLPRAIPGKNRLYSWCRGNRVVSFAKLTWDQDVALGHTYRRSRSDGTIAESYKQGAVFVVMDLLNDAGPVANDNENDRCWGKLRAEHKANKALGRATGTLK